MNSNFSSNNFTNKYNKFKKSSFKIKFIHLIEIITLITIFSSFTITKQTTYRKAVYIKYVNDLATSLSYHKLYLRYSNNNEVIQDNSLNSSSFKYYTISDLSTTLVNSERGYNNNNKFSIYKKFLPNSSGSFRSNGYVAWIGTVNRCNNGERDYEINIRFFSCNDSALYFYNNLPPSITTTNKMFYYESTVVTGNDDILTYIDGTDISISNCIS